MALWTAPADRQTDRRYVHLGVVSVVGVQTTRHLTRTTCCEYPARGPQRLTPWHKYLFRGLNQGCANISKPLLGAALTEAAAAVCDIAHRLRHHTAMLPKYLSQYIEELGYNVMKVTEYFVSLQTCVVIAEEYNAIVNSDELIGTT